MRWKSDCDSVRESIGLAEGAKPWTGRCDVQLRGVAPRARDITIIDTVWARACKDADVPLDSEFVDLGHELYVDLSQNLSRKAFGASSAISLATNTTVYSFKSDSVLTPMQILSSLGCGDARSLPPIATVMLG